MRDANGKTLEWGDQVRSPDGKTGRLSGFDDHVALVYSDTPDGRMATWWPTHKLMREPTVPAIKKSGFLACVELTDRERTMLESEMRGISHSVGSDLVVGRLPDTASRADPVAGLPADWVGETSTEERT